MRIGGVVLCILLCCALHGLAADTSTVAAPTVLVEAERPITAASNVTFGINELERVPHTTTQDLLRIVPGLVIAQHAGGGKAEQLFLRGFDADHGTDVNINVDGTPVNMVSHGHGQGYADLHFIIPELVERIDVVKGPYSARFGDLTTAGAISLHLADTLTNNILKAEVGSFGFARAVGLATTAFGTTKVYGGGEFTSTAGYFQQPQHFQRANAIVKTFTPLSPTITLSASALTFSSSWNASGQIPARAVASGLIDEFGSIDPTEGGNTVRSTIMLSLDGVGRSPFQVRASFADYRFQLFSNFTFYAVDSVHGDMIEQTDRRQVYSVSGQRSFTTFIDTVGFTTVFGASARHDVIHAALYHDQARMRLATTQDGTIEQTNVAAFVEETMTLGTFRIEAGARADVFRFQVTDLGSDPSAPHGMATSIVISPKLNASYAFHEHATLFLNSGFGFHSNDARVTVMSPPGTTIPRAFGAEIGSRWSTEFLSVSLAAWLLDLDREFIWVGDAGTTELAGRSRRIGFDIDARLNLTPWLTVGGNATASRGRLRDEPDGEDRIPLAPPFTLTSFLSVSTQPLTASLRVRHIGARPANEVNTVIASGYSILDLTVKFNLTSSLSLGIQVENILNTPWREAQFDTMSRLQGEPTPISEIHFTPGTPRAIRVGVEGRR